MSEQRNVLTIATGKNLYFTLAINLARSFIWWNQQSGIKFYIITDLDASLPPDVISLVDIKKISPNQFGEGFSTKLYLDQLTPHGKTLFIDSDCLIFGDLSPIFEAFNGKAVSVVGGYISEGEWFGDVKHIIQQFNVPQLPKFNGGIYYIEKGDAATGVYQTARKLEKDYDKIGFVRLRNKPNDEVLMALAMQLHGMTPVPDDGTFMSDPQACPGGYDIDVIRGNRWLINPPAPDPLHQNWYPFEKVSPLVFHFLGYYTAHYPYMRESFRLKKALLKQLNWAAELVALATIEYPAKIVELFKSTFRPLYHKLFGFRKVKVSKRI